MHPLCQKKQGKTGRQKSLNYDGSTVDFQMYFSLSKLSHFTISSSYWAHYYTHQPAPNVINSVIHENDNLDKNIFY